MTIKIPSMPAPETGALSRLIAVAGPLPAAYLDFVAAHDGAEPEPNLIEIGADNDSGVRAFIAVAAAICVFDEVEGFPRRVVPLANDDCGNFFYLRPATGQIFFWDHEVEGADIMVAADLSGFLSRLQPFDTSSVRLAPGQVISAWVDPNFKPEF